MTARAKRYDIETTELIAGQEATREVARPDGYYVRYTDYLEAARAVVELANRMQMIEMDRWKSSAETSIHYEYAAALKARYEEELKP